MDKVRNQLQTALEKLFDVRTSIRAEKLDSLEARIAELKEQLNTRKDMKDQLVEIRFQTIVNEANGLAF